MENACKSVILIYSAMESRKTPFGRHGKGHLDKKFRKSRVVQ